MALTEVPIELSSTPGIVDNSTGTAITIDASNNTTFADNVKAIFGAGSDLQIYHDGSASYIADTGTGTLNIKASGSIRLRGNDTDELLARFNENGSNQFYYDSAEKLATTSTGIDVTGTVTTDGLTVDGDVTIAGSQPRLVFEESDTTDLDVHIRVNGGDLIIDTRTDAGVSVGDRIRAASNGDISFYEDTGTTAKLFWDASAESLGIGTSSPTRKLHVNSGTTDTAVLIESTDAVSIINMKDSTSTGDGISFGVNGDALIFNSGLSTERMRIDSSGNVGIGGITPTGLLTLGTGTFSAAAANTSALYTSTTAGLVAVADGFLLVDRAGADVLKVDTSGNLLVGTTDTTIFNDNADEYGFMVEPTGQMQLSANDSTMLYLNRQNGDGTIVDFRKDGAAVGSIGVEGGNNLYISASASDHAGLLFSFNSVIPMRGATAEDNIVDLGTGSFRYDDIYATNATIQTSDRNEKQDIAELDEAERRVAVACKGLLRKFRWKSSVEENGDDARIHFGIIAQDLKAAFEAEGLDAGRYAMFINSTWTDEETGEERSRMGVRYSELLAFIIAAI